MKILILGAGGREHALAWKLSQSPLCSRLFIAPGNAGTAQVGKNVLLSLTAFEEIKKFCVEEAINMVVVGPEEPLVKGIVDFFHEDAALSAINVIGPSAEGAQLEGSKAYAKAFMSRHAIPTADYREFNETNYDEGVKYITSHTLPVVLKADGLAAGKGVLICQNHVEAIAEFELMIQQSKFGEAGKKVVIEDFLSGIELSVFALTDGKNYVLLPSAKDYKRIGEGDTGLNTGGMGAVSPVPFADQVFMQKIEDRIIRPTVAGLEKDGIDYRGFIFFGIIKVGEDPQVIEYNCRLGDPETEVIIPRLKNDLVDLFDAVGTQTLDQLEIVIDPRTACTVMAVSGGYPGEFEKGLEIMGLAEANASDSLVFHAATRGIEDLVMTTGGRVLTVTSFGNNVQEAVNKSKDVLEGIYYDGIYFRRDIGYEFE